MNDNSSVSGNTAGNRGGGAYQSGGTFTVNGGNARYSDGSSILPRTDEQTNYTNHTISVP